MCRSSPWWPAFRRSSCGGERRRISDSTVPPGREGMKNKGIVMSGGAGLIGSHIADLVAADAAEVVVLDNFVRGRRENLATAMQRGRITIVEGDLMDRPLV